MESNVRSPSPFRSESVSLDEMDLMSKLTKTKTKPVLLDEMDLMSKLMKTKPALLDEMDALGHRHRIVFPGFEDEDEEVVSFFLSSKTKTKTKKSYRFS